MSTSAARPASTAPCPADQAVQVSICRSGLADIALAAGIEPSIVRGYLSATYRLKASDCGLGEVSP